MYDEVFWNRVDLELFKRQLDVFKLTHRHPLDTKRHIAAVNDAIEASGSAKIEMGRVITARSSSAVVTDLDVRNSDCVVGTEPELTTSTSRFMSSLSQARGRNALLRGTSFVRRRSVLRGTRARGVIIQGQVLQSLVLQSLVLQSLVLQSLVLRGLVSQGLQKRPGRDDPETVNLAVIHHNPIRS